MGEFKTDPLIEALDSLLGEQIEPLVFCSTCQAEGERSVVFERGSQIKGSERVVMLFWDEDGHHHEHDPNITTYFYACSRKHRWSEDESDECWCRWNIIPEDPK